MREIKFRAWNKKENQWCYLHFNGTQPVWVVGGQPDWGDVSELMQFTGLKDKNGKEIYEGDLYKDKKHGWTVIKYHERMACFSCVLIRDEQLGHPIHFMNRAEIEVIGNIYENPELLKTI